MTGRWSVWVAAVSTQSKGMHQMRGCVLMRRLKMNRASIRVHGGLHTVFHNGNIQSDDDDGLDLIEYNTSASEGTSCKQWLIFGAGQLAGWPADGRALACATYQRDKQVSLATKGHSTTYATTKCMQCTASMHVPHTHVTNVTNKQRAQHKHKQ